MNTDSLKKSSYDSLREAKRKRSLGQLGELFAIKALVDNEFDKIRNLNDEKFNYPFFDLSAVKDNKKYLISVKARNKYQADGKLNSYYKLGPKSKWHSDVALSDGFVPCWLSVQFDIDTYSVFFGEILALGERNSIPMDGVKTLDVGISLVLNKRHQFDFDFFSNVSKNSLDFLNKL
jgi:hypothetical protein